MKPIFRCDEGFNGDWCQPIKSLLENMNMNFSLSSILPSYWSKIIGGKITSTNDGCGNILAGESMYFGDVRVCVYYF